MHKKLVRLGTRTQDRVGLWHLGLLVTARIDGKTLTWVGKEGIHSETVNFLFLKK